MGTAEWVIPVASLSAICAVGLVFFWWWFPRTWRKGNREEMEIMAAERRMQREHEERSADEVDAAAPKQPPKTFVYKPPTYATY